MMSFELHCICYPTARVNAADCYGRYLMKGTKGSRWGIFRLAVVCGGTDHLEVWHWLLDILFAIIY